jgi:tetratricopeptide (TPR) repeat protein
MGKASRRKVKKTAASIPEPETIKQDLIPERFGFFNKSSVHIILIALLGLLAYSNTFNVPFQWDDHTFIEKNPIIRDLNYFIEPSTAAEFQQYTALVMRYAGYLTFALNYKLHGFDVTGYHIFNFTVHILNALLVYFLVILTFKTPLLERASLKGLSGYIALFASLLFISHPVQTEAVTYIFQRLASLVAFFYILSLVAYIKSRLSIRNIKKYSYYSLSLISAVIAMKTKENAFTLPIAIALYEFFFFTGRLRRRFLRLTPLLLAMLIIPLSLIDINTPFGEWTGSMRSATRGYEDVSRGAYLLTQFRVLVTYIRLLFLPVNQQIDYDYPVFDSMFTPQVFLSLLFLLPLLGLAYYLFRRSRIKAPEARVLSFGILWFFITLAVESSFVSIPTIIDEYRVYLPSVGAFLALSTVAFIFIRKVNSRKIQMGLVLMFFLVPAILAASTFARNRVWETEISLWQDVVDKNPQYPRGIFNLGKSYLDKGFLDEAEAQFLIVAALRPDDADTHKNLGKIYSMKKLPDKAIWHYQTAAVLEPASPAHHISMGLIYVEKGAFDSARIEFEAALELAPGNPDARNYLNYIFNLDKARSQ